MMVLLIWNRHTTALSWTVTNYDMHHALGVPTVTLQVAQIDSVHDVAGGQISKVFCKQHLNKGETRCQRHWRRQTGNNFWLGAACTPTVSRRREAQVPHSIADQLGQLLPFGAAVEVEALLGDALGVVLAGVPVHALPPDALLAQSSGPLHALLPQEGVLRWLVGPRLLHSLLGVLTVVHTDRHLWLGEKTRINDWEQ